MKRNNRLFQILALLVFSALSACSVFQNAVDPETVEEEPTPIDSLSYALGTQIGSNLLEQGFEGIDPDDLRSGILDAMSGTDLLIEKSDAIKIIDKALQAHLAQVLETRRTSARLFLEDKAQEQNIIQLESGLLYEVLWEGDSGERPIIADLVKVQMEGRLLDGKVFETTYTNARPVTFALKDQIEGLSEGIRLMRPGSKFRFYLPPELAFGKRGNGVIGSWEVLVYEIELIEVIKEP